MQVYNLDGTQKYTHSMAVSSVGPDSTNDIFTLPSVSGLTATYFLRLTLTDASNNIVSLNTYWLSTSTDVVNWATYGNPWQYTPQSAYANLTALATMPAASLTYSQQTADSGTQRMQTVTLTNTGSTIAFFVRLKINKSTTGDEVLPILWQDNYVTLLPGESRQIKATYFISDLGGASPVLQIVPYLSNVSVTPASGGGGTVATPTFSPAGGTYSAAQSVTISTTTSGASIRYTTDGSTPSETAGTLYSGPVNVSAPTTLKAIAYENSFTDSAIASATYTVNSGGGSAPITLEVENLSPSGTGATVSTSNDANASGGVVEFLNSTAARPDHDAHDPEHRRRHLSDPAALQNQHLPRTAHGENRRHTSRRHGGSVRHHLRLHHGHPWHCDPHQRHTHHRADRDRKKCLRDPVLHHGRLVHLHAGERATAGRRTCLQPGPSAPTPRRNRCRSLHPPATRSSITPPTAAHLQKPSAQSTPVR